MEFLKDEPRFFDEGVMAWFDIGGWGVTGASISISCEASDWKVKVDYKERTKNKWLWANEWQVPTKVFEGWIQI